MSGLKLLDILNGSFIRFTRLPPGKTPGEYSILVALGTLPITSITRSIIERMFCSGDTHDIIGIILIS